MPKPRARVGAQAQSDDKGYNGLLSMQDIEVDASHPPTIPALMDDHKKTDVEEQVNGPRGLDGDRGNIALLTFLYVLQGIPLGLAGSIPYLLQHRAVSYKDQALFSFVYWPFSVKLLWAPIVDAAYFPGLGRRKTWLIPTQYLLGIFMLLMSGQVGSLLGEGQEGKGHVQILTLTVLFFMMNFLAATQDIAVDGWALTMLARRNVAWASTCNTVGQTAGYFIGNVVFLALESPGFCNSYLRSEPLTQGVVTLGDFLYFWGIVFMVTTTAVMLFKRETDGEDSSPDHGIRQTYSLLWRIVQLAPVKSYIIILLTMKIGFAATDGLTGLKLIEEGVPREKLALLGIPMVPIQIILPFIISKYTTGPRPIDVLLRAMPYRLGMGLVLAGLVWWTPSTKNEDGEYPLYLYGVILLIYALHQVTLYSMFVAGMSFSAKISDPAIGGTYMTLLNTVSNLGGNWPTTAALWCVDSITWKGCSGAEGGCYSKPEACVEAGGTCITTVDGYYIETALCIFIGFVWLRWRSNRMRQLQLLSPSAWTCS